MCVGDCKLPFSPEDKMASYPDFLSRKPQEERNKQAIGIFVSVWK
jgi:hypothetical protein